MTIFCVWTIGKLSRKVILQDLQPLKSLKPISMIHLFSLNESQRFQIAEHDFALRSQPRTEIEN